MKRLFLLICLISTGALAGATVGQGAATTTVSIPIDRFFTSPCNGDTIELTGSVLLLISSTSNANNVSGMVLHVAKGIVGTDLTTGAHYQGTGETLFRFSMSTTSDQNVSTFVNNFKIIGTGTATPNYLVHENTIVAVNPDGTVIANVDNFSIECS